jgi:hypothetical protein
VISSTRSIRSVTSLPGSVGWWLPKWMERSTPKISIEGDEWFAEYETPQVQSHAPQEKHKECPELDRTD